MPSLLLLLVPLMVVLFFFILRRCERCLWEQCFLLLLFHLAKVQLSAIHHRMSPLLAPASELLVGMLGRLFHPAFPTYLSLLVLHLTSQAR